MEDEVTTNLIQDLESCDEMHTALWSSSMQPPKQQASLEQGKGPQWLSYFFAACILVGGVAGITKYVQHLQASDAFIPQSRVHHWKHCGNSSREALGNNCVLDFIAGAWVPRDCYDPDLEKEFLDLKEWHWYADDAGNDELSIERIRHDGGPNPIFVTIEYHWIHCSFTWKKFHRSRLQQMPIDTHIGAYEHTVHCADGLANRLSTNETRPISRFYHHFESCQAS